jgi:hypothetical protein
MRFLVIALGAGLVLAAVAAAALPIDDRRTDAGPPKTAPGSASAPTATPRPARRARNPPRAHCAADVAGCRAVRGQVIYVERVDPDGDGDLHVVVLAGHVTAPGATAIDVSVDLRPRHDPRIGDLVSAAGPVPRGHLDQSQIHALVFHAQRR